MNKFNQQDTTNTDDVVHTPSGSRPTLFGLNGSVILPTKALPNKRELAKLLTFKESVVAKLSINFRINKVICVVIAISSLSLATAEAGTDGKYYPATFCQVAENSDAGAGALRYGVNGMVMNNSNSKRMRVTCPIIRDEINTNRGVTVNVYYHDSHPNQALACELFETNLMGNGSHRSDRFEVPEFRPFNVNIGKICNATLLNDFPEQLTSGTCARSLSTQQSQTEHNSASGSGYVLHCGLPPKSKRSDFTNRNPPLLGSNQRIGRSGIAGYYVRETEQ